MNKMYLLVFSALLLLLISTIQFLVSKKLVWEKNPLDIPLIIFPTTIILSIIFSSPNKIQALLNPTFGIVPIFSLTIIAYYLSRNKNNLVKNALAISAVILSVVTIILNLPFFKNMGFPTNIAFLKNPLFTPIGSQFDLIVFIGFVLLSEALFLIKSNNNKLSSRSSILRITGFTILSLGFLLSLYSLIKLISTSFNQSQTVSISLPPFRISWYAAVETLKNLPTALFGVGVDNFSSMFTRMKDVAYNQSSLWQTNSFTVNRSAILHIFTETGLFGLVAFGILIFFAFKQSISSHSNKSQLISLVYLFICLLFFPPTIFLFFLFYFHLATTAANNTIENKSVLDISEIIPLYIIIPLLMFIFIGTSTFLLVYFGYLPELYFYKSISGYSQNNIKTVYDNQRQAIIINPYIEKFRINFSQTNLLIANNIASKTQTNSSNLTNSSNSTNQLSDQDRQTIAQAIQAAIAEAKAAVSLNPQKAGNWENLAIIYRNILNVAQGADAWTISAYQRAIILDPQNPMYRLNLGGVYYSLNNWDEAYNMFGQSVALKNNWANAYYNLAWAAYQKKDYSQAVNAMQNALNYLDANTSKSDYDRAQKELEDFKKKLPKEESPVSSPESQINKPQLSLPSPAPTIEPKIQLPKNASPEAK